MKYFNVEFKNEKFFMGTVFTKGHFQNLTLQIGLFKEFDTNKYIQKIGFRLTLDPYERKMYKPAAD